MTSRPAPFPTRWPAVFLPILSVLLLAPHGASAQELDPGAYWPLPVGLNILTAVNNVSWGDLTFDPSLPVEAGSARINTSLAAYTRALSIAGRSANAGVQLPVVGGHVEGLLSGVPAEAGRFGLADPRFRLAVNLYGAPAMAPKGFAGYRLRTIVGASVTVVAPLGQYDPAKVINLGTNRWSVKSELGLSHAIGPWVVELMGGMWVFTDNSDFVGGKTRQQDPILSTQVHLTYRFRRPRVMWIAADANFYKGGRTAVNGVLNLDLQKNSRVGATFSAALNRRSAIRASVSQGAYTTIGADFTAVAVGYNYAWLR
jgi:Putative MetA-pathway of phenol degradation